MSKIRKIMLVILSAVFVCVGCAAIVACNSGNWREPKGGIKDNGKYDKNNPGGAYEFYYPDGVNPKDYEDKSNRYVISTVSMGGMPLNDIRVTVSRDGSEIVEGYSQKGVVEFGIPMGNYDLSYSNLPDGYSEDSTGTLYHLTPESLEVKTAFTSSVIKTLTPAGTSYKLGDVMHDFTITDADNVSKNLADILEQKRLVVLNFWATWCIPCVSEFPLLNATYKRYTDTAEVIAITQEGNNTARGFKNKNEIEFFMAQDGAGLFDNFDTGNIPVSVFIDRYGVVGQIHQGAITNELQWEQIFSLYTGDDYQQDLKYDESDEIGSESEPVKPGDEGYEDFTQELESNEVINRAFLDADAFDTYKLEYRNPDDENDALYNWPWRAKTDEILGTFLSPSNIGVNNSFSIICTEITIEEGDTLSLELRINTTVDCDKFYVVVNNSLETTYEYSGATNGWEKLILFNQASRTTTVTIDLVYQKDTVDDVNEFVGVRNLKVTPLNLDSNAPNDVRTEVVKKNDNGQMKPTSIPELDSDGFYHMKQGNMDSILFVNIIGETLWSDIHLPDYELRNTDNQVILKSIYNISYWVFNDLDDEGNFSGSFHFGKEHTDAIIDSFYIQDSTEVLVPVTERVAEALKEFVKYAANSNELKGYVGGYDPESTWLELCNWYRTLGDNHDGKDHVCLATTNPAVGRNIEYAIALKVAYNNEEDIINSVDTNRFTLLNFAGGLFYKLTAEKSGVYRIQSHRPIIDGDNVDPKILIWPDNANVMGATGFNEQEDSRSMKDYLASDINHNNFNVILYLEKGETVYPQITTRLANYTDKYDVRVDYLGEEWWEFEVASIGGGMWIGESITSAYYAAVEVTPVDGYYYRLTDKLVQGSMMYIDLTHKNFYDSNGHSIEEMVEMEYFNLGLKSPGSPNYTSYMNQRIAEAKAKDPDDPTYGMVEADAELVEIICEFTNSRDDDGKAGIQSGIWEAFAYYWEYYGSTPWKDVPDEWVNDYLNK